MAVLGQISAVKVQIGLLRAPPGREKDADEAGLAPCGGRCQRTAGRPGASHYTESAA